MVLVLRGFKQKILNYSTIIPNSILLFRELHDDEIEDEIREAFRCFDRDGHGFIPISGWQNRISNYGGMESMDRGEQWLMSRTEVKEF